MPKKRTSFALDPKAIELLNKLCELDNRSQANMIEELIKAEGKKRNIKIK